MKWKIRKFLSFDRLKDERKLAREKHGAVVRDCFLLYGRITVSSSESLSTYMS